MPELIAEKAKKIALTLALLGTFIGGSFVLHSELNPPITYDKYEALIKIYDYEIKELGGITFRDVKSKKQVLNELNTIVRERVETKQVLINGETLEAVEYTALKNSLLDKVE